MKGNKKTIDEIMEEWSQKATSEIAKEVDSRILKEVLKNFGKCAKCGQYKEDIIINGEDVICISCNRDNKIKDILIK